MGALYDTAKERVLVQFSSSSRFLLLLEAMYNRLEDTQALIEYLRDNLSVDTAEGVWLDILGDIVGVERPYLGINPANTFTFKWSGQVDDPSKGFYSAGPPETGGYLETTEGALNPDDPTAKETDENYRKLIKAKAIATGEIGTFADIYTYLKDGFGVRSVLSSDTVGEIKIELLDFLSMGERAHIKQYGPRLAGVRIEFINWPEYEG